MRVAIYYDADYTGRNDGNPLYITNQFKKLKGCELVRLAPRPGLKVSDYGKFDFHISVDWGEDAFGYPEIEIPHPNIYWASDTHLGFEHRLKKASKFDVVFVAQKDAVAQFAERGVRALWLPHAAEPQAYTKIQIIKKYDICFIGHLNTIERVSAIDRMFKEVPIDLEPTNWREPKFIWGVKRFEDAARNICESKVAFNIAIKNDINMRMFETMCCGGFLLTTNLDDNGIEDLFPNHVSDPYFADYKTIDEAVEKAKYYVLHDIEREAIASRGYEWTRKNHTFKNRVDYMLTAIKPFVDEKCKDQISHLFGLGEEKWRTVKQDENKVYRIEKEDESAA